MNGAVRLLAAAGIAPPEDIADCAEYIAEVLWLAARYPTVTDGPDADEARTSTAGAASVGDERAEPDTPLPSDERRDRDAAPPRLEPADADQTALYPAGMAGTGGRARVVDLPSADPLSRPMEIARALRPFKAVRKPGRRRVLDVDRTVEATADARRLVVVSKAVSERKLEAALVVDAGTSMVVWDETSDRLQRVLERVGAFRAVTRWDLVTDDSATGVEGGNRLLLRDAEGTVHRTDRIVDPAGRRLVLLVTDAVGDFWYRPEIWRALQRWARAMPTAIVQVLPSDYWPATALGTLDAAMRSPTPASPNSDLQVDVGWWSPAEPAGAGHGRLAAVPVVALDPANLDTWARAVVTGAEWVDGVIIRAPTAPPPAETNVNLTAADRVAAFHNRASEGAISLAETLAAAHELSLPLIHILQSWLLPHTGVTERAEVFVGGLLEPVPAKPSVPIRKPAREPGHVPGAQAGARPPSPRYRFRPGVAKQLRPTANRLRDWETLDAVSHVLAGQSIGNQPVLVVDPAGNVTLDPAEREPFAMLEASLAARLGVSVTPGTDVPGQAPQPPTPQIDRSFLARLVEVTSFVGSPVPPTEVLQWLRTAAEGLYLVTGEAGAGKSLAISALVALGMPEWVAQLADVVVPLNQNALDRDAFAVDLAVDLAGRGAEDVDLAVRAWTGDPHPHDIPIPLSDAVARAASRLGRPATFVFDGLDQSDDPDSIARTLTNFTHGCGIRMVVASRRLPASDHLHPDGTIVVQNYAGYRRVVVSHLPADERLATWIAWLLREHAFHVLLHDISVADTSSLSQELDRTRRGGKLRIIPLLSSAYLRSTRGQFVLSWLRDHLDLDDRLSRIAFDVDPGVLQDPFEFGDSRQVVDLAGLGRDATRERILSALDDGLEREDEASLHPEPGFPRPSTPPAGTFSTTHLRIFISYSHLNNVNRRVTWLRDDLLNELEQTITDSDIDIFLADETLEIGGRWRAAIERSLNTCDFFLPICTERYFTSDWCAREWGLFRRRLLSSVPVDKPLPDRLIPIWWRPLKYIPPILKQYNLSIDENPIGTRRGLSDVLARDRLHGAYPDFVVRLANRIRDVCESSEWRTTGRELRLTPEMRAFEFKYFHRRPLSCNVMYAGISSPDDAGIPSPDDVGTGYDSRDLWDPFRIRETVGNQGRLLTHWQAYQSFPVLILDWILQRWNMVANVVAAPSKGGEFADELIQNSDVPTIVLAQHDTLPYVQAWLRRIIDHVDPDMVAVIVPVPPDTVGGEQAEDGIEATHSPLARIVEPVTTPRDFGAVLGRKLRAFQSKFDPPSAPPIVNPFSGGQ